MAFGGRISKPLPRAWASTMKADRQRTVSVVVQAPRGRDEIMADPRTTAATRAWIIRMEQLEERKRATRIRRTRTHTHEHVQKSPWPMMREGASYLAQEGP